MLRCCELELGVPFSFFLVSPCVGGAETLRRDGRVDQTV